jgi:flavin reductase (DIM6/NTAB) family NADH-FMN oxidoreductase RutF
MADGMNASSKSLPPEESEWPLTGFHPEPGVRVRPARIRESFVQLECRVYEVVRHGTGPGAANYVIGEVLIAHLRADLIVDGKVDPRVVLPIARLGGDQYLDLAAAEVFRLARP